MHATPQLSDHVLVDACTPLPALYALTIVEMLFVCWYDQSSQPRSKPTSAGASTLDLAAQVASDVAASLSGRSVPARKYTNAFVNQ